MGVTDKAKGLWAKNKYYIIIGLIGVAIIFIICCCCICRKKMKKKKKKDQEKVKLKGAKPGKKLQRIQPGKIEKKAMEELGSLKFVVRYDMPSQMLMVTIMEAEDIPVRDLSGYAYSFVVAKAKKTHEEQMPQVEYKTKLVRAGFWPTFNDTIEFTVKREVLDEEVLDLYLYEMNRWTKHDGIGQVTLELGNLGLQLGKEHVIKRKLKPYDPLADVEVETASIQIGFEYDSEDWKLDIEVIKADIIPADENKEKEDSYVTLTFLNKEDQVLKKLKTKTRKGTLKPEFGDTLSVDIPDNLLPDIKVKIKLKASKTLTKPVIGETLVLPTSDHWQRLLNQGDTKGWFHVFKPAK